MVLMMNPQPTTYMLGHPSYEEMIKHAISSLRSRNGSSCIAIAKFIDMNYGDLPNNFRKTLLRQTSRAVAALLRRLAIPYIGNESFGKIRINGVVVKKWLQPKLTSPFSGELSNMNSSQSRLGRNISLQHRNIRIGNLSLE
ncbi:hypothetical protein POM88_053574 [Heracleum sosnowskyi]|uniref:H15 domain-containing protein n=1 Tax=Heracleum sosnowskyi TaxID=360622 RepID=A0AAD8GNW9_9APIA|nr:hypothetical protein POM88_053574 [Heracleum sosnowskyi]